MLFLEVPQRTPVLNVAAPVAWEHPLNRGLVGWWLAVPELTGGARWVDLLGCTHGTLSGFASSATATSGWGSTTRPGGRQELRFGGTDDGVTLGNPPHLQLLNTLSIALWFRTAMTTNPTILIGQEGISSAWNLRLNRAAVGDVTFGRSATTVIAQTAGGAWAGDTWTHLVYTRPTTGATHAIYLNGKAQTLTVNNNYTYASTGIKTLGTVGTTWFTGLLDDVQFYNRALSAAEVAHLYQESCLGSPTRLTWFPLAIVSRPLGPPPTLLTASVSTGVALVDLPAVRLPLLATLASTGVALVTTILPEGLRLPVSATTALGVSTTVEVQGLRLLVAASALVAVSATASVERALEGVLAVGEVTSTLALSAVPTLRLPVLPAVTTSTAVLTSSATVRVPSLPLALTESLTVGDTATMHVPLLRLTATEALAVSAAAIVLRTAEGLLQVGQVTETVALPTTVTLRVPFLTGEAGSTLAVGALPTVHMDLGTLHPDTGLGLATAVTLHLRLSLQASEALPVTTASVVHPTLVLLTTETVGVGTSPTLTVRLHAPSAEMLSLGTQVALHMPLYPQASESLSLGETLTLTGVLRLTSTSAVVLETTAAFSVGLLSVQAGEVLPLTAASFRITGLSLRGLHAATPTLRQGAMQGSLRQADAAEPTLEQAEVDDAILV